MQTEPEARYDEAAPDAVPADLRLGTRSPLLFRLLRGEPVWLVMLAGGTLLPLLVFLPVPWFRIPLGIALVLFAPGYALVRALLGDRYETRGMYGTGLGFGVSIAILPFIALALDITGLGIQPTQTLIALAIWICFWTLVGLWRRYLQARDVQLLLPRDHDDNGVSPRAKAIPLLGLGAMAMVLLTVLMTSIGDSEKLETEFYALGEQGEARDYPYSVGVGRLTNVTVGVTNLSEDSHSYAVKIVEVGNEEHPVKILAETEFEETSPGDSIERQIYWRMHDGSRERSVRIDLYRDGDPEIHRQLTLNIEVLEPETDPDRNRHSGAREVDGE
jgi:uncharacterized membrane protein